MAKKALGADKTPSPVWGKHLIIDAYGIEAMRLKDSKKIRALLDDLPKFLKMRILHQPVLKKVASPDYPDWGLSGFVMLYESHISLHTWPEEGYVAMDIYSCKDFDEKKAMAYLKKFWNSNKEKIKVVVRK